MEPLILGSGSFSRKVILKEMGIEFEVMKSNIDEQAIGNRSSGECAHDLVLLLANSKADALLDLIPLTLQGRLLLTADQVIVCNNEILEKPLTAGDVRAYIARYAEHPCRTVGSIVLTDTLTKKRVYGVDTAITHFREFPSTIVDQLIAEGMVMHCAGGLMIEHPLIQEYIIRIDGTQDSVMGLSKQLLLELYDKIRSHHR